MTDKAYKQYKRGVRMIECATPSTLVEIVAGQLAIEKDRPSLDSLGLIELGAVYVNGARALNPAQALNSGDLVRIFLVPRRFKCPPDFLSSIIEETEDSLLIEKPAGLPAEAEVDNVKENLLSFLEDARSQQFYLTHRLASESEGLMLIAKSFSAKERISRAFTEGRIKRVYSAFVEAPVKIGLHTPRQSASNTKVTVLSCEEQKAETNLLTDGRKTWQIKGEALKVCYRIEIEFTGLRPKDIREHLAACGAPIVGDYACGSRYELIDPTSEKSEFAFHALSMSVTS